MQAAAVLGSDFSAELIARVLGSDPLTLLDVWGELERAHIFSGDRFSHDLIYEAVAASLPQQVARLLNQRCAEVLAQSYATPARVARHHLAGGDDEKAAPYLLWAAERAKDALRLVEAAERYDRAGGIFERLGRCAEAFEAYRAALKLRLEFDPGDHEGALTKLRADAGTPLMRALVWRLAAEQRLRRGDYAATEAAARSGLAELGAHPDERARTELLTFLAGALARQGREAESSAVLAELRTLTEALEGGTWLSVQLSHAASVLDDLGRSREAFGLYRRALGMQSRPRDRPLQLADYAYSLLGYGDAARALEALQEARARLEGVTDVPVVAAMVTTYLGATYHHLGRYAEALATFDAFLEGSGRHHAVQREAALVRCARLYLTLGAPQKAEADLVAAQRVPAPRHMYQVHLETTLGRLRTLQGNHEAAAEAFARVEARLREAASPRMRALVRFGQATALPRAARLDLAEEVLALSQKLELPSLDIGAHTLYAQRLLAAGDAAGARSHTRKAVTLMNTYTSG